MAFKIRIACFLMVIASHFSYAQNDTTINTSDARTKKWSAELSEYVASESVYYFERGYFEGLPKASTALVLKPLLKLYYAQKHTFVVSPFARFDPIDKQRTHADLREAYWKYTGAKIELQVGVCSISWGNMLGPSMINILNQKDEREEFLKPDVLGQPLVSIGYVSANAGLRFYVVPYFRRKDYPNTTSRLFYFPIKIDNTPTLVESEEVPAIACRYSQRIKAWDIAISHFYGTNRNPTFQFDFASIALRPQYTLIHQSGVEIQYVRKSLTAKLEVKQIVDKRASYGGFQAGLEYSISSFGSSNWEGLLIIEYMYDDWKIANHLPLSDNFFAGIKLDAGDVNNTNLYFKVLVIRESTVPFAGLEASRRLSSKWKAVITYFDYFGTSIGSDNAFAVIKQNRNMSLTLKRFF